MKRSEAIVERPFWALSVKDAATELAADPERGLAEEEALRRLRASGLNIIERPRRTSALFIFARQFKSPLILVLLLAGLLMLAIGHVRDAAFILAAALVNALLGFSQEFKAEKALSELKTYLKQRARVLREGKEYEIDAAYLVPGDFLRLSQGDRVPADIRFTYANDLQVDEAILTGESLPVPKSAEPSAPQAALTDQHSMAFAGTLVTQGVGTALVCRTGFTTEIGRIAELVAESHQEKTPLQRKIGTLSLQIGSLLGVLTILLFGAGIMLGYSSVDMFLTSVAVAVGAVPEGLPVAMTVILAVGVERMARRKGVVRKLVAAEALGSATVILTDKTGTLTQANMTLSAVIPARAGGEDALLKKALLNTRVLIENPHDAPEAWRMSGRVLEVALTRSAAARGVFVAETARAASIASFLPFNAVNKFSVSLVRGRAGHGLVFFGAPDVLLSRAALPPDAKKELLRQIHARARSGELVLGVATKPQENGADFVFSKDLSVSHLTFEGLITLRDPIRPNVRDAIRRVEAAGIRTIVATGDHRGTAESVAREVGLHIGADGVLDAKEFRLLSDEALTVRLKTTQVVARVTPFDKLRIVRVLRNAGEVVAMTGDGVNDAPSIRQADIGIAMGSGTEVARDVADLVLLNDDFETIVAAVEEGRQITRNIQKVMVYLLSSVTNELMLIGGALASGVVLPLNALQILWVNFFSDSFPAVAFAFERTIDGLGVRHPGGRDASLFTPVMRFLILFIGLSTSALLFVLYWVLLEAGYDPDIVRTFIFASFGTYTLFLAFSLRSLDKSIFSYSLFANRYLVAGGGAGILLMLAAVYLPFLQAFFGTVPLSLPWAAGVFGVGLFNIAAVEFGKWLFRSKELVFDGKGNVG